MTVNRDGFEVEWTPGSRSVVWRCEGRRVEKTFTDPPVSVCSWLDPPSVVVVEGADGSRLDNAVVFEPDGLERLRLVPPDVVSEPSWRTGFYAVYENVGQLVAVFSTAVGDYWGKPDLRTGLLTEVSEWR